MRSKLLVGMVLAATVFSLVGCGVKEKKGMKADKVSVNTGRTLEERREARIKADIEGELMALSKNCLYSSDYTDIIQWNRKGEKVSSTRKKGYTVETCSDKCLICTKYIETADGKEIAEIYSIPIKQTEGGESVQWAKEEKVASSDDEDTVFLFEPYLIYVENENTLTRLNLETKEKKTMKLDMSMTWFVDSYITDGLLYVVKEQSDEEIVYCIRIDDWTLEKLYVYEDKTGREIQDIYIDGQFMYVLTGDSYYMGCKIECYDMEKRKVVGQLAHEKIDMLLQKEGVTKSDVVSLSEGDEWVDYLRIYAYEGRLYLSIDLGVSKSGDGRCVLLSCPTKEMTKLRYERELSEWWYENCLTDKDTNGKDYLGEFLHAYEDVFYFTYMDKQEEKDHLMCYHLDTKKWEEVPENELVYRVAKEMEYIEE